MGEAISTTRCQRGKKILEQKSRMGKQHGNRVANARRRPSCKHSDELKAALKKIANWKTSGLDGIHGFWFKKKFTAIHDRLATEMNKCIQKTEILKWMTKGKPSLIQKDPLRGRAPTNYRPITCLPMMWKILMGQIKENYYSLISRGIFSNEQKGCRKRTRGIEELQYINTSSTKVKQDGKTWIYNKKAYRMVP